MDVKGLGGNIKKYQDIVEALKNIKNNQPEFVNTDQNFSEQFLTDIDKVIQILDKLVENLENKADEAAQYVKWSMQGV